MRKTLPWFSLCLLAACDSGQAPPGSNAAGEPLAWPVNRDDLVFVWESAAQTNVVGEGEARRVCEATARERARCYRNFEMDLGGGFFEADASSAEMLRRVLGAGGAFCVEALVTADGEKDGTILRSATLGLFQRGNDLVLTAAEPSPVSARVGRVTAGKPAHFAAVFDGGDWQFYLDGAPVEGEAAEAQGEPNEEIGLVFGGGWEGKLMAIAMSGRAPGPAEIAAHHRYWEERIAARPKVARLKLKAKLVRAGPAPGAETPGPRARALAGCIYEVEEVMAGDFEGEKLEVMHWAILDGRERKSFPREEGKSCVLEVEPLEAHPQLESETAWRAEDGLGRALPLYYDVATPGP